MECGGGGGMGRGRWGRVGETQPSLEGLPETERRDVVPDALLH